MKGTDLKIILLDLKLTQTEAAKKCGYRQPHFNRILNKDKDLRPNMIVKIAKGLELPIEKFTSQSEVIDFTREFIKTMKNRYIGAKEVTVNLETAELTIKI